MPWDDEFENRPVRTTVIGLTIGWFIFAVAIVLVGVLSIGLWFFGVFTSDIRGQGEQQKQVNSAINRTDQYNHFFDLNSQFQTQIGAARLAMKQLDEFKQDNPPGTPDPLGQIASERSHEETNLTGAEQICIGTANTYNNDSEKTVTGAKFKDGNQLPDRLDPNQCEVK